MFKSRTLSKSLKVQLYRTLIQPVVIYGCETLNPFSIFKKYSKVDLRRLQYIQIQENK